SALAQWSVTGVSGTVVSDSGELSAGEVSEDTLCTLTGSYDELDDVKSVQIIDVPIQLDVIALEVRGSAAVDENLSAPYTCIAYFSDESWQDVTDSCSWSVDPSAAAAMQGGQLNASLVNQDSSVDVLATFSGVTGSKSVLIRDVVVEGAVNPIAIEVIGPQFIRGGRVTNFVCELVYSDNTRSNVTAQSQWISTRGELARFRRTGFLVTGAVEQDTPCNLIVRYITAGGVLLSADVPLTLTRDAVEPDPPQRNILIYGDDLVKEGATAQYQAVFMEDEQPAGDITGDVTWSVDNSTAASIDSASGVLTALQVQTTVMVAVRADYSLDGEDYSATYDVEISPVVRNLHVNGDTAVNAGSSTSYQAVLSSENEPDMDVTDNAVWSVDNTQAASIDQSGVLTAMQVEIEQQVNVTAVYQVGVKAYTGSVAVAVSPVLQPEGNPTGVIITGPDVVESGSTGQYVSTLTYANGATSPAVPGRSDWSVNEENVTISSTGLLTAEQTTQPSEITVILRYDRDIVTKSVTVSTRGKFALAGVGNPEQSVVNGATVSFREGEQCTVAVQRYQGGYEAADAYFDLTPPDSGIVLNPLNWADGEEGVKYSATTIPVQPGVQPAYSVEVLLTSPDITVNAAANRFVLEVLDADYGSSVADYMSVFEDIDFVTSQDEWFYPKSALDSGENMLRSMSPDIIGETCELQSSMTGPGILTLYAGLSNAEMTGAGAGMFYVAVDEVLYTIDAGTHADVPKSVVIPDGNHSVSFVFERTAATVSGDFAWIMDPEYIALDKAELLSPADGSTVLVGDKAFIWSNVLCGLCDVPGVTAGYQLYAGSDTNSMQLIDTIAEFDNTNTVTYPISFETTGNWSWSVETFVQVDDDIFNFSSDPASFSVLDATAPQFVVSEAEINNYFWLDHLAYDGSSMDITLIRDFDVNVGPVGYSAESVAEDIVVNVISGSLPSGITPLVDTENGFIYLSGSPTTVGSGSAVLQIAMIVEGTEIPGTTLLVNYDIIPLPPKLIGQYNGFVWYDVEYNCTADDFCMSAYLPNPAVVTVDEQGLVTVSFQLPGGSYNQNLGRFDAATYYRLGVFEKQFENIIDEDTSIDYTVSINWNCDDGEGNMGTPVATIEMQHWYLEYMEDLQDYFPAVTTTSGFACPDIWASGNGEYDTYDQQVLDKLQGYYTVSLDDNDFFAQNYDSYGNGYLTMTVNDQGSVSIAGKTADGQSIDVDTKLYVNSQCEDTLAFTEFRSVPVSYVGGSVYMQLHFIESDGHILVEVRDSSWVNMDPEACGYFNDGFSREFNAVCGGKYDNTKNLPELFQDVAGFVARYPVYEDDLTDVTFSADGNSFVIDSQSGMSLSVDIVTGVISVSVDGHAGEGVLTPYFRYIQGKESIAARAYILSTSYNFVIFEDDSVYQYTKSSAWQLETN
ncbi:MAG: hypothetical protein R6V06_03680, partial [Kiritimatiellia bacterium]